MSKLHPLEEYTQVRAGENLRLVGTIDRRWPTTDHAQVEMTGRCIELGPNRAVFEIEDPATQMKTTTNVVFSHEVSEPEAEGSNSIHAEGKLGFLTFAFDDPSVAFEEEDSGALQIVADGKMDVAGPVDLHARVTVEVWKADDLTRVRFVAVRKNGKCLGKGELSITSTK